MSNASDRAHAFLGGEQLTVEEADGLWRRLKGEDQLSLARALLERMRRNTGLLDGPAPASRRTFLCQQHALLTSKDAELSAAVRHDRALDILREEFDLESAALDGDGETLSIAGGIYKRRRDQVDR